jgi:energy-coupling factor transport system ATP-binding protein
VLIRIENLTHIYAPHTPLARIALHDIDLDIRPGERVGVVGSTGSGKSTLVQHVAGLLTPASGRVLLDGTPAHKRSLLARIKRQRVGLAFQYPEDQIFEQTVFLEVGFGLRHMRLPSDVIEARVRWALQVVGLVPESIAWRNPLTLSGGEMRRVALASILSMQPEVLILDEPTAGMDPRGRHDILYRIRSWQANHVNSTPAAYERSMEAEPTLIVVSHDMAELARTVDRVILMREGHLVADGPVHQVLSDSELLTANGLETPYPVRLLRTLHQAGWQIRTDLLLPETAAAEIARVMDGSPTGQVERSPRVQH